MVSRWKSDQKKLLEKYALDPEVLEGLLQAVVEGDEHQYDAIRKKLSKVLPETDS